MSQKSALRNPLMVCCAYWSSTRSVLFLHAECLVFADEEMMHKDTSSRASLVGKDIENMAKGILILNLFLLSCFVIVCVFALKST